MANFNKSDKKRQKGQQSKSEESNKMNADNFEAYNYEYSSQVYMRPIQETQKKTKKSTRQQSLSPGAKSSISPPSQRAKVDETKQSDSVSILKNISKEQYEALSKSAVRIQSQFRGHVSRKLYWKEKEHQSVNTNKQEFKEEYSEVKKPGPKLNVAYNILCKHFDPNLGLIGTLTPLNATEQHNIMRIWKIKGQYSDGVPTTSHLFDEEGPQILITGGINPLAPTEHLIGAAMFVYNPLKDKTFYYGTMPEPRNYHAAVFVHSHIYIIGGNNPFLITNGEMVATSTVFQLTARSNRWRRREDMTHARAFHAAVVFDDCIMVAGGRDNTGQILSSVEMYDPIKDFWTPSKSMPEPLMGIGMSYLDGYVWVIGGITNTGPNQCALSNRAYCFDPAQQLWLKKAQLDVPICFCSAVTLKHEIWIWGGCTEATADSNMLSTSAVQAVPSDSGSWEMRKSLCLPKHAMALAKAGRKVYMFGGITSVGCEALAENDVFDRENDFLRDAAGLPHPATGSAAVSLPVDYSGQRKNKWIGSTPDLDIKTYAATKIQALFRGYSVRQMLQARRGFGKHGGSSRFYDDSSGVLGYSEDQWKAMAQVCIAEWPPRPDINTSRSSINLSLGALPPGYEIVTQLDKGTRVRRYVTLPRKIDPNLGAVGYMDDTYKKAKRVLGLRRVDLLPSFASTLRSVEFIQDDSVPVALIMGGLNIRDPLNFAHGRSVLRYHPLKDRWEFFGLLPEPRNYHSAVLINDTIYMTGGYNPDMCNCGEMISTKTVYSLNIFVSEWTKKADMIYARAHHALVAFSNKVYAIGGRDSNGRLIGSTEQYNPDEDVWKVLKPMTIPRMGMCSAVYQNSIWCLGGIGPSTEEKAENGVCVLASSVSYDPNSDTWKQRPPLRRPRAFASAILIDDVMWICGGCSLNKSGDKEYLVSMAAVDAYNPDEALWEQRIKTSIPRHCAASVKIESCIYLFGGICTQEWGAVERTEMIITDEGQIRKCKTIITEEKSAHSCRPLPVALTGMAAVSIPPVFQALRAKSLSLLLERKFTYLLRK